MKTTKNHVFFWGGIYSQWHKAPMKIDGVEYNCCEQYMMHQKAVLFGDEDVAEQVLATKDPKQQKALGRKVKGFNSDVWDKACISIVYKANLAKFSQNEELKAELLATGDRILVEASPLDSIWGIGLAEDAYCIDDPATWKGKNLLGWCITLVRKHIS